MSKNQRVVAAQFAASALMTTGFFNLAPGRHLLGVLMISAAAFFWVSAYFKAR